MNLDVSRAKPHTLPIRWDASVSCGCDNLNYRRRSLGTIGNSMVFRRYECSYETEKILKNGLKSSRRTKKCIIMQLNALLTIFFSCNLYCKTHKYICTCLRGCTCACVESDECSTQPGIPDICTTSRRDNRYDAEGCLLF